MKSFLLLRNRMYYNSCQLLSKDKTKTVAIYLLNFWVLKPLYYCHLLSESKRNVKKNWRGLNG